MDRDWEWDTESSRYIVEERPSWMLWGFLVAHRWKVVWAVAVGLLLAILNTTPQPQNSLPQPLLTTTTVPSGLQGAKTPIWGILEAVPAVLPGPRTGGESRVSTTQPAPASHTLRGAAEPAIGYPAAIRAPRWVPSDECARVDTSRMLKSWRRGTNPWSSMRWCPVVANYLYDGQRRGLWKWEPGDLTRLMVIMHCESAGSTRDPNPASTAYGLYQFLDGTWRWLIRLNAHGQMGFDNPNRHMAYDQIAFGVWLYKVKSAKHWPNCGRW